MPVVKYVNHSRKVGEIAIKQGWLPGARYTNLRDVKTYHRLGFLDIDWKNYDFEYHLDVTKKTKPILTIAKDIERKDQLRKVIDQAYLLREHAMMVALVPKPLSLANQIENIPEDFIFAYSVPTSYGGTRIPPEYFTRPVHLLGGRPLQQLSLGKVMDVVSLDCNSFTIDASFGKFFNGKTYPKHPRGGYANCVRDSIKNINSAWLSI